MTKFEVKMENESTKITDTVSENDGVAKPISKKERIKTRLFCQNQSLVYAILAFVTSCFCFVPYAFIVFFVPTLVFLYLSLKSKEAFYDLGGRKSNKLLTASILCIIATILSILLTSYAVIITYVLIF